MAALLLVLTLVPAATAATTQQDQLVQVNVMEAGILWIGVDEHVHFGDVYPGQYTNQIMFGTGYTNTLEGTASWSATVTATNFLRYHWVHPEGYEEGWDEATTDTIAYTNLTIFPGYNHWAATEAGVTFGPQAAFGGTGEISDPVTMFTAGEWRGHFGTHYENWENDLAAWVQLFVPTDVAFGAGDWQADYRATLTYTLTG
jgi:hypothetical protein